MNKFIEYLLSTKVYYKERFKPKNEKETNDILLICRHALGDTVVESPFIRAIRKNYPHHHIMLVCSPENYSLLENCPYVDEIIPYDNKTDEHFYTTNLKRCKQFAAKYFADKSFELAIIPSTCMAAVVEAWLIYFSHAKRRVSYTEKLNKRLHKEYMGAYDRFFTDILSGDNLGHEVENNNAILKYLKLSTDNGAYELWTDDNDKCEVDALLNDEHLGSDRIKCIVNLSTSSKSKDWPVERYIEVCKRIDKLYSVEFLLIGAGKSAREYGDIFLAEINDYVHDFINKTTIRQMAEIMRRSDIYFGGDTGPLHMAAACHLSGVAIYKSADNTVYTYNYVKRLYPWRANIKACHPQKALPGCEKDGCNKNYPHCINVVFIDEVYQTMLNVLKAQRKGEKNNV